MEFKQQGKMVLLLFYIFCFCILNVCHFIQPFKMTHLPLNGNSLFHVKDEV